LTRFLSDFIVFYFTYKIVVVNGK